MKVSVHEDNDGALILARTLSPTCTPRSKYCATKTIWFVRRSIKGRLRYWKSQQLISWETFSLRVYIEQPLNTCRIKSWVGNSLPSLRTYYLRGSVGIAPNHGIFCGYPDTCWDWVPSDSFWYLKFVRWYLYCKYEKILSWNPFFLLIFKHMDTIYYL